VRRAAGWLGPFTTSGAVVAVLGVVSYVVGWRLGWIELMVVAAGCLISLLIAVAFVVGRLGLRIERTIDPQRVMVGEPAGALLTATNPTRRPTRSIVVDDHIGTSVRSPCPRWRQDRRTVRSTRCRRIAGRSWRSGPPR
jgi:uncharacterized protein (DUF58 family)